MFVNVAILGDPLLHDPDRQLLEVEVLDLIGETAGGVGDRRCYPPPISSVSVQHAGMRGVDGILHWLQPVAVQDGLDVNTVSAILPHPQVVSR